MKRSLLILLSTSTLCLAANDVRDKTVTAGLFSKTPGAGIVAQKASPFSPLKIAKLKYWFKMQSLGVHSDNDVINTLPDSSPNNLSSTNIAAQWRYYNNVVNGQAVMRAAAAMGYYKVTFPKTLAQPITVVAVSHVADVNGAHRVVFGGIDLTDNDTLYYTATSAKLTFGGSSSVTQAVASGTGWLITTVIFNGASSSLYVNGALNTTGNVGTGGLAGLTVGAYEDGSSQFVGDMTEIVVINDVISTADRNNLEKYLETKYGITPS